MSDSICNRGHTLILVNNGKGTSKSKTKCNMCNVTGVDFSSCTLCNYDLCKVCQEDQIKLFEKHKSTQDCHYDKKNLNYVNDYLDANSCLCDCGKDSEGYILCRCGMMR